MASRILFTELSQITTQDGPDSNENNPQMTWLTDISD